MLGPIIFKETLIYRAIENMLDPKCDFRNWIYDLNYTVGVGIFVSFFAQLIVTMIS